MGLLKKNARAGAWLAMMIVTAAGLVACGDKSKQPGQALAAVDGQEITISQLNDELARTGTTPAQQQQASKQLLDALIDRQLLQNAAAAEKLDRDPKVVQAIERAKALILAQAYMQKRLPQATKPTQAEVADYFQKNPAIFSQRKQFDMRQLVIATGDMNDALKATMDAAKSLDEVAAWLDAHQVKYARAQLSRSSADLPPELSSKLLAMPKGQLFVVKEGARSMLMTIVDTRDAPVTLEAVTPQIEQLLVTQRNKQAADAEVARLRAAAKIERFGKDAAGAAAAAEPAAVTPAPAPADDATERGVKGLK